MLPAPEPTPNLVTLSYVAMTVAHAIEAKFLKLRFTGAPWMNIAAMIIAIYYAVAIRFGLIHFGWHHMIEGLIYRLYHCQYQ